MSDPTKDATVARDPAKDKKVSSRRDFFKGAAAGAVAVAVLPTSAKADDKERGTQYAMVIDVRRCIGCHACSVACKAEFDVPLGKTRSWVEYIEEGNYPYAGRSFLPRLCNHCSHPPCVPVCPTGATYKRAEDGIVVVDSGICIGCKYCIQACPYDARFLNPVTGTADKCDFCIHRVSQGLVPACVETCVGNARIFGDMHDPDSEVSHLLGTQKISVLRELMGTSPNVYYIDADHSDEHEAGVHGRYVRVTTHRKQKKRR